MKLLSITLIILLFAGILGFWLLLNWLRSSNPKYVVNFLKKNASRSSIYFKENGNVMIDLRSDQLMPLASTVKIMIALEFAHQSAEQKLDGKELIPLKTLENYYLPSLDGGAHEAWLRYLGDKKLLEKDLVELQEIARGMITFSSNANTEYLLQRLGIHNIEERMKRLGIKNHSALFYYESFSYLPYEVKLSYFPDLSMRDAKDLVIKKINNMDHRERTKLTDYIHKKLTADDTYKKEASILDWWNEDYDMLFSEFFTRSSTYEYTNIMSKINEKTFPPDVQVEIEYLLGALMDEPKNQEWLKRAGYKSGSTKFILTSAMYAEDTQGYRFEFALFFNYLLGPESLKLRSSINDFQRKLLNDKSFREEVYSTLNKNIS